MLPSDILVDPRYHRSLLILDDLECPNAKGEDSGAVYSTRV